MLYSSLSGKKTDLLRPKDLSALNAFASDSGVALKKHFLAAAAEHYACALRIPLGDEQEYARQAMNFPAEYVMPCFIAIGKPAGNAIYHIQNEHDLTERVHLNLQGSKWERLCNQYRMGNVESDWDRQSNLI